MKEIRLNLEQKLKTLDEIDLSLTTATLKQHEEAKHQHTSWDKDMHKR